MTNLEMIAEEQSEFKAERAKYISGSKLPVRRQRERRGRHRCKLCGDLTARIGSVSESMCTRCYQKSDSLSLCDWKHCYTSRMDAQATADELNSQAVLRLSDSEAYYCGKHKGFHVGHARSSEDRHKRGAMLREIYRRVRT